MSSTASRSTNERPAGGGPSRPVVVLAVVSLALLGALVWALNPRRPKLAPAALEPLSEGCPVSHADFVPTNVTAVAGVSLETLSKAAKNRTLLRMNMEPCSCGCVQSIAQCRVNNPSCPASAKLAGEIVAEEEQDAGRASRKP